MSNPTPLDYAPPLPWHRRRKSGRILLALAALLLLMAGWQFGPGWWRRGVMLYWQHRCMTFTIAPETVVFDEGPDAGAFVTSGSGMILYAPAPPPVRKRHLALLQMQRRKLPVTAVRCAECWSRFSDLASSFTWPDGATIFCHEMVSTTGVHRLVILQHKPCGEDPLFIAGLDFDLELFDPGTISKYPTDIGIAVSFSGGLRDTIPPPNLKMYAGQIDPTDPSHFTVQYAEWGQSDTLDGWLRDSGNSVQLKPRHRLKPRH